MWFEVTQPLRSSHLCPREGVRCFPHRHFPESLSQLLPPPLPVLLPCKATAKASPPTSFFSPTGGRKASLRSLSPCPEASPSRTQSVCVSVPGLGLSHVLSIPCWSPVLWPLIPPCGLVLTFLSQISGDPRARPMGHSCCSCSEPRARKYKCGLPQPCPEEHLAFRMVSGAANVIGPKICLEDKM